MPKETKITHVEKAKRLRAVQEWLIDDWPACDIVTQSVNKWGVSERQAKRYLADARDTWVKGNQEKLNAKRSARIEALKKLKRSMKEEFKGTPAGMRTVLQIDKELARLEGAYPTKQMIEAAVAEDAGRLADPLSPTESKLMIEAVMPYETAEAFHTANTNPTV